MKKCLIRTKQKKKLRAPRLGAITHKSTLNLVLRFHCKRSLEQLSLQIDWLSHSISFFERYENTRSHCKKLRNTKRGIFSTRSQNSISTRYLYIALAVWCVCVRVCDTLKSNVGLCGAIIQLFSLWCNSGLTVHWLLLSRALFSISIRLFIHSFFVRPSVHRWWNDEKMRRELLRRNFSVLFSMFMQPCDLRQIPIHSAWKSTFISLFFTNKVLLGLLCQCSSKENKRRLCMCLFIYH